MKYNFIKRLKESLKNVDSTPPQIIEASRKYRQALLKESHEPQAGAYWFVPENDGSWQIQSFFESLYPNTDHHFIWSRYLCHFLFNKPTMNVKLAYAGLPRGRVVLLRNNPVIYHGNDLPQGDLDVKKVIREFNLPKDKVRVLYEEHEQMIPEHYYTIKNALKYKQKLKEPMHMVFDDDE